MRRREFKATSTVIGQYNSFNFQTCEFVVCKSKYLADLTGASLQMPSKLGATDG